MLLMSHQPFDIVLVTADGQHSQDHAENDTLDHGIPGLRNGLVKAKQTI